MIVLQHIKLIQLHYFFRSYYRFLGPVKLRLMPAAEPEELTPEVHNRR